MDESMNSVRRQFTESIETLMDKMQEILEDPTPGWEVKSTKISALASQEHESHKLLFQSHQHLQQGATSQLQKLELVISKEGEKMDTALKSSNQFVLPLLKKNLGKGILCNSLPSGWNTLPSSMGHVNLNGESPSSKPEGLLHCSIGGLAQCQENLQTFQEEQP